MPSRIYELGNTAGSPLRRISIIIAISCNASCPLQLLLLLIIMIFLMCSVFLLLLVVLLQLLLL